MLNNIKPQPGPIADLLRKLQSGGGWSALVTPDMKAMAVARLVSIVKDDESGATAQIAATNCLMRASDLDRANIETAAKLIEVSEIATRLERIEASMAGESETDQFIEIEQPEQLQSESAF